MFLDHPILGVGPGGFAEQVERYAPLLPQLYDIQPTPHNAFIQMAAEAGIFGLLASVLVLVSLFRVLRGRTLAALGADERRLQFALIWSLAAVGVASLASWPLSHGAGEAIVLVLALACAGAPEREPGAQPAGAGR
jgi:O-antigen ligase